MTITTVIDSFIEAIRIKNPRCILFGEIHQQHDKQSAFRGFFSKSIRKLSEIGYKSIFLELNHEANEDFQSFLQDKINLSEFRSKWLQSHINQFMLDSLFISLKNLTDCNIFLINNVRGAKRDIFMYDKIHPHLKDNIIFFGGQAHMMIRPTDERLDWISVAEMLNNNGQVSISVAELSRAALFGEHDYRIKDMLDEKINSGVSLISKDTSTTDFIITNTRIGIPKRAPEYQPQTLRTRPSYFNFVFIDYNRFLAKVEESEKIGNSSQLH